MTAKELTRLLNGELTSPQVTFLCRPVSYRFPTNAKPSSNQTRALSRHLPDLTGGPPTRRRTRSAVSEADAQARLGSADLGPAAGGNGGPRGRSRGAAREDGRRPRCKGQ